MSAIPSGYEPFQGLRRKSVTLLCILLASAMSMGILVYVDSYSVYEWDNQINSIGPVAMSVTGANIENYVDEILNIPEVEKAHYIEYTWGRLQKQGVLPWELEVWGRLASPSEEYYEGFPDTFRLTEGRYPENNTEITISMRVEETLDVSLGEQVNYTYDYEDQDFRQLNIVGIFFQESIQNDDYYWWYGAPLGIISSDLLRPYDTEGQVDIDIDRTTLTPFNSYGALAYVLGIEESIRLLDPAYDPQHGYGNIYIDDSLARGITLYRSWLMSMRINQLMRAGSVILLVGLVLFLAIRHNVNERRYENNMLMSRGASRGDVERRTTKEILWLALIGSIAGLGVGVLFSRFGLASIGFFEFNPILFFTEPFLITIESLLISMVIGMVLPFGTWMIYKTIYSTRRRVEEQEGKLQKLSRGLVFIRWDVVLLILSSLFLIALLGAGPLIQYSPIFSMIIVYIPLAVFLAIGSLSIKALRRGAKPISRGMTRIVGVLPSMVGVRRVGKSASSAGPAVLVLVLSMSIAWTYAIIGASMPVTKLNQGRLAFGGDVAFHLGSYPTPEWNNFTTNVTNHELHASSTMVSATQMRLSAGYWDSVDVLAINAEEFSYVGYDHLGNQLNNSAITPLLATLATTPAGAIVTSDIAVQYALTIGDTLRGFAFDFEGAEEVFAFSIIGIADALTNARFTDTGTYQGFTPFYSWQEVGLSTMWVNREYLGSVISLANSTENILCVRTYEGANSTQLVEDVLDQGGSVLITDWASASYEVDNYIGQTNYQIDRAVDTMLTIASSIVILGAFIIYAFEGVTARKREIALIRSMGGDRSVVIKSQIAEMLVLLLAGLVILLGYGPLHIGNTLLTYRSSYYLFPVQVYMVIPWLTLLTVLLFFIGSVVVFIVVVAFLGSRVKIAESLNASWAESGPYGGDV